MEGKTLNAIQRLCGIIRVVVKIVFVISVIGAVSGLLSCVIVRSGGNTEYNGTTLLALIGEQFGFSENDFYVFMLSSVILCVTNAVVMFLTSRYLRDELTAGTPFTFEGAKQLLSLGIVTLVLPVVSDLACSFILSKAENGSMMMAGGGNTIVVGIVMIMASLLCRLGAENSGR